MNGNRHALAFEEAVARPDRALREPTVSGDGMTTTAGFLREILVRPHYADAKHTTSPVEEIPSA
jgi:pyruvate carboxylase